VPKDIGISGRIMLLYFPETVVEREILVLSGFEFFEDDVCPDSGKNSSTK